jgi:hypothetical protein
MKSVRLDGSEKPKPEALKPCGSCGGNVRLKPPAAPVPTGKRLVQLAPYRFLLVRDEK